MRRKWMRNGVVACVALMLLLNTFAFGALAAETLDVKIPVVARGADCTAVLLDSAGAQVGEPLALVDGVENAFTVTCEQLGRTVYTLRLTGEGDANVRYDETVYEAAVTLYLKDSGDLGGLVEIRPAGDVSAPKKEIAEFENETENASVWIDPPVQKRVQGNPATNGTFTFVMTAVSNTAGLERMPMPNGATAQSATMQIVGEGEKEFGRIEFTQPGTYVYSIAEQRTGAAGYTFDSAVYTVTAVVTAQDGSLSVDTAITRDGDAAEKIVFTNVYAPTPTATSSSDSGSGSSTGSGTSPSTGDERNLALWIGASIAVLLAILALAAWYIRQRRRDKRFK